MDTIKEGLTENEGLKLACLLLAQYKHTDGYVIFIKKARSSIAGDFFIMLPEWLDVLAMKLKARHGVEEYPFILSHIVRTIVAIWMKEECITVEEALMLEQAILLCYHPEIPETIH